MLLPFTRGELGGGVSGGEASEGERLALVLNGVGASIAGQIVRPSWRLCPAIGLPQVWHWGRFRIVDGIISRPGMECYAWIDS